MDRLLPLVSAEVGFSIDHSMSEDTSTAIKGGLKSLSEENPVIAEWITRWAKMSKDKCHVAICGLVVYQLLKSQAEADKMAEELKLI